MSVNKSVISKNWIVIILYFVIAKFVIDSVNGADLDFMALKCTRFTKDLAVNHCIKSKKEGIIEI